MIAIYMHRQSLIAYAYNKSRKGVFINLAVRIQIYKFSIGGHNQYLKKPLSFHLIIYIGQQSKFLDIPGESNAHNFI